MPKSKNIPIVPRPVYSNNGTVIVLRIPENTLPSVRKKAINAARQMADNESSTYTSNYRSRRYTKKNQIGFFL